MSEHNTGGHHHNRSGSRPQGNRGGYRRDDRDGQRREGHRGGYRDDDRRGGRRGYGEDDRRGGRGGYRDEDRRRGRGGYRDDDRRGGYRGHREEGREDQRRGGYRGGRGDKRDNDRKNGGERRHAQRAGHGRKDDKMRGPQRSGFREERIAKRQNDPDLPADLTIKDLDPTVLQDLRSLSKDNADAVGKHMIMAAILMEDDPQLALRHARAAKDRAGRVSVVRETCGIAAYHAEEWKEALSELRAARRISGGPGLLAVMADCERGLGRPEKAIEMARDENLDGLDADSRTELAIVVAGARRDLGQLDAAVVELQKAHPDPTRVGLTAARLDYAYADALLEAGRTGEAKEWFAHAATADQDEYLDARERLEELN